MAPEIVPSRAIRLLRVAVLLIAGLVIAFSATLHEQLGFDLGVATAALGAIGIAHLIEWFSLRPPARTVVPLLLGVIAVIAAVLLPFSSAPIAFAVVVAAWALASALLEFIGAAVRPGSRQDATLLGGAGVLLALLVLLFRDDQVAILGFFGAYALLTGVFLGISAFDTRRVSGAAGDAAGNVPAASTPLA
ncbi:hypothetical protein [Leucobacter chromiireducens]|uniref:hypothetical protein n=1 Tax=Leucobacter chromiireducens TaxID=283877 RepID=UPI0019D09FFD|nr:hypothetical protein [Leucobacter chromiireducens]